MNNTLTVIKSEENLLNNIILSVLFIFTIIISIYFLREIYYSRQKEERLPKFIYYHFNS